MNKKKTGGTIKGGDMYVVGEGPMTDYFPASGSKIPNKSLAGDVSVVFTEKCPDCPGCPDQYEGYLS